MRHPSNKFTSSPLTKTLTKALCTSLCLILSLAACSPVESTDGENKEGKKSSEKKVYKVPVETIQLSFQNINNTYRTTAVLEAKAESKVVNKVTGMITDILVEEGMPVTKGQVLAKIDAESYQLDLERATIDLDSARAEYERSKPINGKQLIAAKDLEKLAFLVKTRTNQQKIAAIKVRDAQVRSPINGVIASRSVKEGNMTPNAGSEMFHIVDLSHLQGVVYLPESQMNHVFFGQLATLIFPTNNHQTVNATVALISPIVDDKSGTFKVTLKVKNEDKSLKPGMFAKVSLVLDTHENVQVVPQKVLMVTDTETSLFTIVENKAKKVSVTTGFEQNGLVEIITPLIASQPIVIVGQLGLKDESVVNDVTNNKIELSVKESDKEPKNESTVSLKVNDKTGKKANENTTSTDAEK